VTQQEKSGETVPQSQIAEVAMPPRRTFRVEKSRVPHLATTFVLLGGISTCIAISVPFSERVVNPLIVVAILFPILAALLVVMRKPTQELGAELYALVWTKPPKTVRYHLKRIRPVQQEEPRQPPTAETIREIRGR